MACGGCMWMSEQNKECLMRSLSQTGTGFLFACLSRWQRGHWDGSAVGRSDLSWWLKTVCSSFMWIFEVHWECVLKCTEGVCNWLDWQALCRLFHMVRLLLAHCSRLNIYPSMPIRELNSNIDSQTHNSLLMLAYLFLIELLHCSFILCCAK